ncbi:MAG TPA: class I SAM-dependent DNA methyltransferase, partial [Promineifilum sp.]|nr:class I SAM-dependent DNA methyltransferase [Promineifilum sp.]
PVLRPLDNIKRMDAILAHDEAGNPMEPEWPAAEVIVGNPPFLGGFKIRQELGDDRVNDLFKLYEDRVPRTADLVVYWFERAWAMIKSRQSERTGLIATQSIRSNVNRAVLDEIASDGSIFTAWSDKPWVLDGAAVRVSIVGFDDGSEQRKTLDGLPVNHINADLTSSIDLTKAHRLTENLNLSFQGSMIGGPFQIAKTTAMNWISLENPSGRSNSDVIRPYVTGMDVLRRTDEEWVVDFGANTPLEEAQKYFVPFEYVLTMVYPERKDNRRAIRRERWWIHADPQPSMRTAVSQLRRYIATVRVAKHRIFVWLDSSVLCSNKLIVIAREDDYFFGVLHSRVHEIWSMATSSRHGVGNDPAYTPTTTFETFPFPWPPGEEPGIDPDLTGGRSTPGPDETSRAHLSGLEEIARWARALVDWRDAWLNPPPPAKGTLDVAWERLIKARTLTNLYNGLVYWREHKGPAFDRAAFDKETRKSVSPAEIQELDDIHHALDAAVLRAYGWPEDLSDEAILERLLALNLERSGG